MRLSSSAKMLFLMSRFSMAASTTRSASAAAASSVVKLMWDRISAFLASSSLPLLTSLSRPLFSRASLAWMIVLDVAHHNVIAVAGKYLGDVQPMVPPPMTTIFFT